MNIEAVSFEPTWKEWVILTNLSSKATMTPTYKKQWADRIGAKSHDPIFSKVISKLIELEIAEKSPWIGNCNVVTINDKKLDKFVRKTSIYKRFKNYVYDKSDIVVGV